MGTHGQTRIVDAEWYQQDGDKLASTLATVFGVVRDENEWRKDKDAYHYSLYEGNACGLEVSSRKAFAYDAATLPDNVCKMAVDTLVSKVSTIRPIPEVHANRGNWNEQRRARKLRQFGEGEFYRQKIHEKIASQVIRDALVCRCGVVQVYRDGKKPRVERVHPWTLYADDWDAEFGEPMTMMRLRTLDRAKAMATLGKGAKAKEAIKNASRLSSTIRYTSDEERSSTVERIELLEAWYRCAGHDKDDKEHKCTGRHVIICDNAVLFDEVWSYDHFPFAILTYDDPVTGMWGSGMVQTLEGYQNSINDSNTRLDEMYALSGKYVVLRDGSGVFSSQIVNGLRILDCKPGPYEPIIFDADLVNEHMRMRPQELVVRGLNATGVSQMSAQSQKPAGVEAGVALQTLDDLESQRHIVFGRKFETWCIDVMRLLIEVNSEIAEEYGDSTVPVPMRGGYLELQWSDVKLEGFQLKVQSVGQLYRSFTGQLDRLTKLFEMGLIDGPSFMLQLDGGDLQSELDIETADRILVDEMLQSMLDSQDDGPATENDDYIAPHGELPLEWAHKRTHQRKLQAEMNGAPPAVLDLLSRFIDDLEYLQDKNKATAMTPDGGPGLHLPAAGALPPPPGPGGLPPPPIGMGPAGDQLLAPPPGGAA